MLASHLNQIANAVEFTVRDQYTCRNLCIDEDYWYFSDIQGRQGKCCSTSEIGRLEEACILDGHDSRGQNLMKYFACPQGRSCGVNKMTAQKYSQKYKVRAGALDS